MDNISVSLRAHCPTRSLQAGFTMVELLMTIMLVALLGAVATTQFIDFRNDAKIAASQKKMFEIREALVGNPELIANGQYVKPGLIVDVGGIPPTLNILVSQSTYASFNVYNKRGWRGPYIDTRNTAWSVDAWGTTISYSMSSRWLKSCGKDLICGGASTSADDITVGF